MAVRCLALLSTLLLFMVTGVSAAQAQAADPHAIYEARCAGCHAPHAGDFVHDSFESLDGRIVGRGTGQELQPFLAGGHGNLTAPEIEVMLTHLTAILEAGGLFHDGCLICHDRAGRLARGKLILRDGRLVGRYTSRDIESFLANHGRLEEAEITTILRMLERQLPPEAGD